MMNETVNDVIQVIMLDGGASVVLPETLVR